MNNFETIEEFNTKDGVSGHSILNSAKIVGIYFGAKWCTPCRAFTPSLIDFYIETNKDGKKLEIIYISQDKNEEDYKESLSTMPWIALPYKHKQTEEIIKNLSVYGLPKLVIIDPEVNRVVVDSARADVLEKTKTCFDEWVSIKNLKIAKGDLWVEIKNGKEVKHT